MIRCFCVLLLATLLCGCGPVRQDEPAPQVEADDPTVTLSGRQAYARTCARCHDSGLEGAPRIGDRDAWEGRSMLWQAVLFEHVKSGYMAMPARGGNAALDDATVARAAEYMLSTTYPEIKKD